MRIDPPKKNRVCLPSAIGLAAEQKQPEPKPGLSGLLRGLWGSRHQQPGRPDELGESIGQGSPPLFSPCLQREG